MSTQNKRRTKSPKTLLEEYFNARSKVFRNLANNTEDSSKAIYYREICYSYLIISHSLSKMYDEFYKIREVMKNGNINFGLEEISIIIPEEPKEEQTDTFHK